MKEISSLIIRNEESDKMIWLKFCALTENEQKICDEVIRELENNLDDYADEIFSYLIINRLNGRKTWLSFPQNDEDDVYSKMADELGYTPLTENELEESDDYILENCTIIGCKSLFEIPRYYCYEGKHLFPIDCMTERLSKLTPECLISLQKYFYHFGFGYNEIEDFFNYVDGKDGSFKVHLKRAKDVIEELTDENAEALQNLLETFNLSLNEI